MDVLITTHAEIFVIIARDVHPIMGARIGPGDGSHLATHTECFSFPLPDGPPIVRSLGATPRYPPRYNRRSPCGGGGKGPLRAVKGYRIPRVQGSAPSVPGAHVGGRCNSPVGTWRSSPHLGWFAGPADVLPRYRACGCPRSQDPAAVYLMPQPRRPPTPEDVG